MLSAPEAGKKTENTAYRWVQRLYELLYQPSRLTELTFYVLVGFVVFTAGLAGIQSRQPVHALDCELNSVALEIDQPKPLAPKAISDYVDDSDDDQFVMSRGVLPRPQTRERDHVSGRKLAAAIPQQLPGALVQPQMFTSRAAKVPTTSAAVDVPLKETAPAPSETVQPLLPNNSSPMPAIQADKASPAAVAPAQPVEPTVQQANDKSCEGGDFGANQSLAPLRSKTLHPSKMGNISPYKLDLISRIAKAWHGRFPEGTHNRVVVLLCIGKDGQLLNEAIVQGAGDPVMNKKVLMAMGDVEFSPLPDWFTGESLSFNVDLSDLN